MNASHQSRVHLHLLKWADDKAYVPEFVGIDADNDEEEDYDPDRDQLLLELQELGQERAEHDV
ncbi:unnamed protein product [Cutaneotrichosporon oleaginosum]